MRKTCVAAGLVLALLLFAGCGASTAPATSGTPTASPTTVASQLCQRLTAVNQALAGLAGVGDNTTVGEVKAAQQKLTNALNAYAALPGGGGDTLSKIQAANDQLGAALRDLPDSATVGQIGPRLQGFKDIVAQAQSAATKLTSTLSCQP